MNSDTNEVQSVYYFDSDWARSKPQGIRLTTRKQQMKYDLYERTVQDPDFDIDFIMELFEARGFNRPSRLREDFCGTAWLAATWVQASANNRAVGVDLDREVLGQAEVRNRKPLPDEIRKRLKLYNANVVEAPGDEFDVITGLNFSFCALHTRPELLAWLRNCRAALSAPGLLLLDANGGHDISIESEEVRDCGDYRYVWQQGPWNPVTARSIRRIHFHLDDGSEIRDAFVYDWRVWSMPELLDALAEVGFAEVRIYWEQADEDGDGNGEYVEVEDPGQDPSWNAYIAAWKT